jgi:hypothetical protein
LCVTPDVTKPAAVTKPVTPAITSNVTAEVARLRAEIAKLRLALSEALKPSLTGAERARNYRSRKKASHDIRPQDRDHQS